VDTYQSSKLLKPPVITHSTGNDIHSLLRHRSMEKRQ